MGYCLPISILPKFKPNWAFTLLQSNAETIPVKQIEDCAVP